MDVSKCDGCDGTLAGQTSTTGNLGGLSGADATCQRLATAVGAGSVNELHARTGDAALFVDERGQRINGQWTGSPTPIQHDIPTGSHADGSLMSGFTCADWTSSATTEVGQVGHSDGTGPGQSTAGALASWNSAHANQNCADTHHAVVVVAVSTASRGRGRRAQKTLGGVSPGA